MTDRKERGVDLEALKKALAQKEASAKKPGPQAARPSPAARPASPAARPAPAAPPQASPPAAPEPPVSFDEEMSRLGVGAAPSGPGKLVVRPPDAPRPKAPGPEETALPDGLDDDALWAHGMRGVTPRGKGIARAEAQRSESLPTLDLHGFSEEDAVHELRRFVQLHRAPQPRWVRVIVGRGTHGTGIVRRATLSWLQANSSIASFRPAPPAEGGNGVVLVQLTRKTR